MLTDGYLSMLVAVALEVLAVICAAVLQRIDMVPELLSSNLCSLRGNEERQVTHHPPSFSLIQPPRSRLVLSRIVAYLLGNIDTLVEIRSIIRIRLHDRSSVVALLTQSISDSVSLSPSSMFSLIESRATNHRTLLGNRSRDKLSCCWFNCECTDCACGTNERCPI